MEFDFLFRWYVGLGLDDPVWDHSAFSKNRDRLLEGHIAAKFLQPIVVQPPVKRLLSSDHFSVDGTLIEAWASIKSFRRKDGKDNGSAGQGRSAKRSFHQEKRSNETHESTTDPEAKLYRKDSGQPAKLCYRGHALMEIRHGVAVRCLVSEAGGTAKRHAALKLVARHRDRRKRNRIILGADKAYDMTAFVQELRKQKVTAHIAIDGHMRKTGKPRRTAIDKRTLRHAGCVISRHGRKRIEDVFGGSKCSAAFAKAKLRGQVRVNTAFTMAVAAYDLICLPKLCSGQARRAQETAWNKGFV
jgi:hypothetical protein